RQYRWLGDVASAGRERLRANLRARASDFSEAFDRELTRIDTAFRVDADRLNADPGTTLAAAYTAWQQSAIAPRTIDAVYLLQGGHLSTMPIDPRPGGIRTIDWPAALTSLRDHAVPPFPGMAPVFA